MALLKRTGSADFPDKLKALVTGPPKSGKTTLLGTVPNILILDTEPKANNLASLAHLDVAYVTIESTRDLREILMILANQTLREQAAINLGMPSIDAVAIDTMDTLQKILKRERMESERTTKFLRDDWSWLKEEMAKIIEGFTALPLHVIFTVHIGSKEVGTEQNPMTKFQPGLEGAIANDIAGMVGYSVRSFRKEEVDATGVRKTEYWLQTEGDETYDFLGTRVPGGGLPTYIKPDFGAVYRAAMAGRPQRQAPAPIDPSTGQPPEAQAAPPAAPPQEAPQAQQQPQGEVQTPVETPAPAPAGPAAGPDSGPAPETAPQGQAEQPPAERPADTEPVNDAALQHVKKVYDALELAFPEAALRSKTLGDARQIVMMWRAVQEDYAQGKGQEGSSPKEEMIQYLTGAGVMPGEGDAAAPTEAVEPSLDGTIEQAKAWVGDGSDLGRVQQAYAHETANKNRKSMVEWLESKGAQPAAPQAPAQPTPPTEQPQQQAQQPPTEGVTQQAGSADDSSTKAQAEQAQNAEAVQRVQEGLGGEVVEVQPAGEMCQADGDPHPIDDSDIAKISETRFGKRLCVNDYIVATKA